MKVEILITESEIAQEFTESLQARDLPEKFFYWSPHSAARWRALAATPRFADLGRSWAELACRAEPLVSHFPGAATVISFGAGDGSREVPVLDALRRSGREVRYFPVDASMTLLEMACLAGEDLEIDTLGIKADISSPAHLVLASDAAEAPKLLVMAGNTLGSFDPLDQIRHLAACLHEGDRLIVDAELYHSANGSLQDDGAQRAFAFAPLAAICVGEDDGEVRFEQKHDERHSGFYLLTRHFRATRDLRLPLPAGEVMLERGERIGLNFHYLYTAQAFRWLLEKHARLKILDQITSPGGRFLTAICAR